MSEEIKEKGSGAAAEEASKQTSEEKEAFVSRKAYEEVTRDMHKNKQKAKELEAAYNELQSQLKAQEEQKMQEQEQWKELYQKREAELEQVRREAEQKTSQYMKSVKVSALKQELGVSIRDEYLRFANLDSITLTEEGSIDPESLRNVANEFRKEHGQLIPKQENVNITGQAPSSTDVSKPADFSKMSSEDLVRHYAKLKEKQ
jgi:hypothetical protein